MSFIGLTILLNSTLAKSQNMQLPTCELENISINAGQGIPWMADVRKGNLSADEFIAFYSQTYLNDDQGFKFEKYFEETDQFGVTHIKYHQTYHNIEVHTGVLYLHLKNNVVQSFNGQIFKNFTKSDVALTHDNCLKNTLESIKSEEFFWQNSEKENALKLEKNNLMATHFPTGKLVYASDDKGNVTKSYEFLIGSMKPFFLNKYFTSISNGKVIIVEQQIMHIDTPTSGRTFYRGTQNFYCKYNSAGSNFQLRIEQSRKIRTFRGTVGTDFTSTTKLWNDSTIKPAYDVHWATQGVYDFWKSKIDYKGLNNKDSALVSLIDFSSNGNAFWDLTNNTATFLSAFTGGVRPCTSVDVVGHEYGHGILDEAAGLVYSGPSCALHEGMADINGNAAEYISNKNRFSWLIGEEPWNPGGIRNMKNPSLLSMPKYYNGNNFGGGCHSNGQVVAHWFYLLTMGDTGTNEVGFAYKQKALGWDAAIKIHYQAVKYYLTPSATYPDYYIQSLKAARDIFGSCNDTMNIVKQAWKIVGLEDTSFVVVDLTHGITNAKNQNVCVFSFPRAITFTSKGDKSRVSTWYYPGNVKDSIKNTSIYSFTSVGKKMIKLRTEICKKTFWDTCYVNLSVKPKSVLFSPDTQLCKGITYTYKNASVKNDTSQTLGYSWHIFPFGNAGSSSTFDYKPEYDGSQIIALTTFNIPNTFCRDSVTKKIEVYNNVKPSFTVKNSCLNKSSVFKNTTDTTGISKITAFVWDLQAVNNIKTFDAQYQYANAGTYNILLTSTVLGKCSDTAMRKVTIYPLPTVDFTYSGNCNDGLLKLKQKITTVTPLNYYQWNLDPGMPFDKDSVFFQLANETSKTIGLTAQDKNGCSNSTSKNISIKKINIDYSLSGFCKTDSLNVKLNSPSVSDIYSNKWQIFNSALNLPNGALYLASSTNDTLKLTIETTNGCILNKQEKIKIYNKPNVNFTKKDACAGNAITFSNTSVNGDSVKYNWDFADGNSSSDKNTSHVYTTTTAKTYFVTLKATENNCSDKIVKSVNVLELPTCGFAVNNSTQGGLYKDFVPSNKTYTYYEWDFGNGKKSFSTSPTHQYFSTGNFTVTLKARNADSCLCNASQQVYMHDLIAKNAVQNSFNLFPNPATNQLNVVFNSEIKLAQIKITDLSGRIYAVQSISNSDKLQFDISALSDGIYLLKVNSNQGNSTIRWIKSSN